MSVGKRWVLACATAALWMSWMWCASVHDEDLVGESLRTLFIVAAVALVLACLVTPMAAILSVGRQIGRAEHKRECDCSETGRVVPFRRP